MIEIEISPGAYGGGGYLRTTGHAAHDICLAVSVLEEALAANLDGLDGLRLRRTVRDGSYDLRWNRSGRHGSEAMVTANRQAGFVYRALQALQRAHAHEVSVVWKRPAEQRAERS